jgi:hypothetical protein
MRVYTTRWFAKFARSERIADSRLCDAIDRAERGLIEADLRGGLIKQRLARPSEGRSGGYRVLIAYSRRARAVFLYGFAKNERDNISRDDLADWQARAGNVLAASNEVIERNVADDVLKEVRCGPESQQT